MRGGFVPGGFRGGRGGPRMNMGYVPHPQGGMHPQQHHQQHHQQQMQPQEVSQSVVFTCFNLSCFSFLLHFRRFFVFFFCLHCSASEIKNGRNMKLNSCDECLFF
jgi:hypothetical protein